MALDIAAGWLSAFGCHGVSLTSTQTAAVNWSRQATAQEAGDTRNGDTNDAANEGQPAAGGGSGRIGRGGDGRRGGRQSGNGGQPAGRRGPPRLDWRPAVDEHTGYAIPCATVNQSVRVSICESIRAIAGTQNC